MFIFKWAKPKHNPRLQSGALRKPRGGVMYNAVQLSTTLCSIETNIKGKYDCETYSLSIDIQFQSSEGSLFSLGKV